MVTQRHRRVVQVPGRGQSRLSADRGGPSTDHRARKPSRTGRFNNVENGKYVAKQDRIQVCVLASMRVHAQSQFKECGALIHDGNSTPV